jgi:hypothetical protein
VRCGSATVGRCEARWWRLEQKQGAIEVDEVDSIAGDRRELVIAKLSPAQIADLVTGRLVIGGK